SSHGSASTYFTNISCLSCRFERFVEERRSGMLAIGIREGSHEPELIEVDKPEAGEGQVLVEAVRVGICGTDREIIEAGAPGRIPEGGEFLILGHEALGRVA